MQMLRSLPDPNIKQMQMLRWAYGHTKLNKIRNDHIRQRL